MLNSWSELVIFSGKVEISWRKGVTEGEILGFSDESHFLFSPYFLTPDVM